MFLSYYLKLKQSISVQTSYPCHKTQNKKTQTNDCRDGRPRPKKHEFAFRGLI